MKTDRFTKYCSSGVLLGFVLAGLAAFLLLNAWVADDAYITLRVVDNFHHGYGLRWNVDERVQVYTHPLWMFVLSVPSFFTGEYYFTTIFLNWAVAMLAVLLVVYFIARDKYTAILAAVLFACSKAFVDFSSSGLENAMSHLCVGFFLLLLWRGPRGVKGFFYLSVAASLVLLNRMDLGLLLAPVLLVRFFVDIREKRAGFMPMVIAGFTGQLPLIIWLFFSLFYYGFPFPNTAYAKLDTGIPSMVLIKHGLYYTWKSLYTDPVTIITELVAILIAFRRRNSILIGLAVGILLYHLYVIKIGGCFMGGRYFTTVFYLAVCMLAYTVSISLKTLGVILPAVMVLGFYAFYPQIRGALDKSYKYSFYDKQGVADEHACYHLWTGLIRPWTHPWLGDHKWMTKGKLLREKSEKDGFQVTVFPYIGFIGFYAGPRVHIIDPVGLGDALLARLPQSGHWHVGHYFRSVPEGYPETVKTGVNQIKDPKIAAKYDEISVITRGPLLTKERMRLIIKANLEGL